MLTSLRSVGNAAVRAVGASVLTGALLFGGTHRTNRSVANGTQ